MLSRAWRLNRAGLIKLERVRVASVSCVSTRLCNDVCNLAPTKLAESGKPASMGDGRRATGENREISTSRCNLVIVCPMTAHNLCLDDLQLESPPYQKC